MIVESAKQWYRGQVPRLVAQVCVAAHFPYVQALSVVPRLRPFLKMVFMTTKAWQAISIGVEVRHWLLTTEFLRAVSDCPV
jgi:hypothetical protein